MAQVARERGGKLAVYSPNIVVSPAGKVYRVLFNLREVIRNIPDVET